MRFYFRILNDLGESYLRDENLDAAEKAFKESFEGLTIYLHKMHLSTFTVPLNVERVCLERSLFVSA